MRKLMVVAAVVASAILSARGDTYTVNEGETQTYDSITNTTRPSFEDRLASLTRLPHFSRRFCLSANQSLKNG